LVALLKGVVFVALVFGPVLTLAYFNGGCDLESVLVLGFIFGGIGFVIVEEWSKRPQGRRHCRLVEEERRAWGLDRSRRAG
jgi:hypothetical protein